MPNNRQNEGPKQNGGAGSGPGAREKVQGAAEQVQQGAESAANRLREGYGQAKEGALHGYRQAEGAIARNPAPSILIGFGVGLGLGMVLASMFTREETWAEKYLPESLQDVPDRYKSLVSSLKTLPKTVHDHLPSSISKHLG